MAAESSSASHDMHVTAEEGSTPIDQQTLDMAKAPPNPWPGLGEAQLREALAASIRDKGPDHIDTIDLTNRLVVYLLTHGGWDEALALAQHVHDYYQRLLPEADVGLCTPILNLAICLKQADRHEEAERLFIKALDITQRTMGHMHPDTITMCTNVACIQSAMGKHVEAEALNRRALDFNTRLLGAEHPTTIVSMTALGMCLTAAGKTEEGAGLLQKALNADIRVHGLQHHTTISAMLQLGKAYLCMDDYAQAERMLRWGWGLSQHVAGLQDILACGLREALVMTLAKAGKEEEALPLWRAHIEMLRLTRGEEDPTTLKWTCHLTWALASMGRYAEAEQLAARVLEPCTRVLGPQHEDTKAAQDIVAECRRVLGAAEPLQAASGKAQRRGRRR